MYRLTLAELVKESKKSDRRVDVDYGDHENPFRIAYDVIYETDAVTVTDMPFIHELPKATEQTLIRAFILISNAISWYFHDLLRGKLDSSSRYDAKRTAYLDMAEQTLSPANYFILCYHVAQETNRLRTLAHERYQREQAEGIAA